MSKIKNPIIPGYYPDPSIIRVGDDFYMACSSFELYPGIPLFHSKDLMHWEQICNVMTMENDFHIEHTYGANGVMAPTLRYHNGTYYVMNANFLDGGNFIVTATDPAGPWSKPIHLDDVPGIDASLFFDNDGQCYAMGTGNVWDNGAGVMERGIWLAKYDIENFKMASEPVCIFNSAQRGGSSPEAPHIYHVGDYYYLIIAEGGTEHYHSVDVARSKELFGFYENCPANPIMSHRQMGTFADISNVGHADLVDTPDGKWYAVMLASRNIDGIYKCCGRETFLCPVEWEWEWPLFSPKTGRLDFEYEGTGLPEEVYPAVPARDEWDKDEFGLHWTWWGTPYTKYYEIKDSKLCIKTIPQEMVREIEPVNFTDPKRYDSYSAFIARRQCQFSYTASCRMKYTPQSADSAGLAIVQALNHQLHFERALENGQQIVRVVLYTSDFNGYPFLPGFSSETHRQVIASAPWDGEEICLKMICSEKEITFFYGASEKKMTALAACDYTRINPAKVGCMVGTMIGMFASGHGQEIDNVAEFDWFELAM